MSSLRIIGADFSPEGYARFTIDRPGYINRSDVRLIEAAPALLAALQALLATKGGNQDAVRQAHAAIAKATGDAAP